MSASKRMKAVLGVLDRIDRTVLTSKESLEGTLATHNGHFHCDEALALAMLKVLPDHATRPILRTRDATLLNQAYLVVDVGAVYDPTQRRFDHHQRGFLETIDDNKSSMKLSSAGLVYKHFGRAILRELLAETSPSEQELDILFKRCYEDFVLHIDGIDNGVEAYEGGTKRYYISTSLSARVGYLNPEWNDETSPEDENERFRKAMKLTGEEFIQCVNRLALGWLPARRVVEDAVKQRFQVHPSGQIIRFETGVPYKSHLSDLEDELNFKALYVLAPDSAGNWRVQCVNDRGSEFVSRKPLPEKYRGLRDDVLSKAAGIPDAIFVHAGGFIGGVKSYEGALNLAIQSLSA